MVNVKVPNRSITAHVNTDIGVTAQVSQKPSSIDNSDIKVVKGDTGAVFTPHVDELSNLSWTNDGGLVNPPTRNIRGRDGDATVHAISNRDIEKIMEG
mgnify:FL=1